MKSHFLVASFPEINYDVFAVYDSQYKRYVLYTDTEGDVFIGEADTLEEATQFAREWANVMMAG